MKQKCAVRSDIVCLVRICVSMISDCLFAGLPVVRLECELVGFSHFVHTHPRTHPVTQDPQTHKHTQNPHPTTQTPTPTQNPHTQIYTHTHLYPTLTTSLTASGRTSLTCCAMNPTCLFTGSQHIRLAAECWYW